MWLFVVSCICLLAATQRLENTQQQKQKQHLKLMPFVCSSSSWFARCVLKTKVNASNSIKKSPVNTNTGDGNVTLTTNDVERFVVGRSFDLSVVWSFLVVLKKYCKTYTLILIRKELTIKPPKRTHPFIHPASQSANNQPVRPNIPWTKSLRKECRNALNT